MALAVLLSLAIAPAAAKTVAVQIQLPADPKIDRSGIRRVLVGGFLHNDFEQVDIEREIVRILRSDLRKHTDFLILEDPPVNLPEQKLEVLKRNAPFFETIAADYRADLIVSGRVRYTAEDRSGFVQQEFISPITGRRSIRTVFVERLGYTLRVDLILVRGSNGELMYETSFFQDEIVDVDGVDPLALFYILSERFRESYLAILTARGRTETRYLYTQ
jgi:hypothetical protein